MQRQLPTLVLIHGYLRGSDEWQRVEWGAPERGEYGRVPQGIVEAIRFDADVVLFGSGILYSEGVRESRFIYDTFKPRFAELAQIVGKEANALNEWVDARAAFDEVSVDTNGEIRCAVELMKKKQLKRLVLVSSPFHIMRSLQDALVERDREREGISVYATASITSSKGNDASQTLIVEGSHRPDGHGVAFNLTLKEFLPIIAGTDAVAAKALEAKLRALLDVGPSKTR